MKPLLGLEPIPPDCKLPILRIDQSLLKQLTCARRVQFTLGSESGPDNIFSATGDIFHKCVEVATNEDLFGNPMWVFNPSIGAILASAPSRGVQSDKVVGAITTLFGSYNLTIPYWAETFFDIPIGLFGGYQIHICGTIDLVEIVDGYLRVSDYKTLWAVNKDKVQDTLNKYMASMQIVFYMWAMRHMPQPPQEWVEELTAGKICGQYIAVPVNVGPLQITPLIYPDVDDFAAVEDMLPYFIAKLTYIADNMTRSLMPAEGRWNDSCQYCEIRPACLCDPTKQLLLQSLPASLRYNPAAHRQ